MRRDQGHDLLNTCMYYMHVLCPQALLSLHCRHDKPTDQGHDLLNTCMYYMHVLCPQALLSLYCRHDKPTDQGHDLLIEARNRDFADGGCLGVQDDHAPDNEGHFLHQRTGDRHHIDRRKTSQGVMKFVLEFLFYIKQNISTWTCMENHQGSVAGPFICRFCVTYLSVDYSTGDSGPTRINIQIPVRLGTIQFI